MFSLAPELIKHRFGEWYLLRRTSYYVHYVTYLVARVDLHIFLSCNFN